MDFWIGLYHTGDVQETRNIDGSSIPSVFSVIVNGSEPPEPSSDYCVQITRGCYSDFIGEFRDCFRRGDYLCEGKM